MAYLGELSSRKKAAILVMSLDAKMPGLSQQLFTHLGEVQSKKILEEINVLGKVDVSTVDAVIEEFFSLAIKQDMIIGGQNVANKILKDSFGIEDSEDYFTQKVGLFDFVKHLSNQKILNFLKSENLQVSALLLSLFPDDRTAKLLSEFSAEETGKISRSMLTLNVPSYAYLWKFHRALEKKLVGQEVDAIEDSQQIFKLSRVLEMMVTDTRKTVMDMITKQDKVTAERIKQLIFSYDDLVFMTDKDLQAVLVEVDPLKQLAISMKGVSAELEEKIRSNVSERLKARLDEEIMQVSEVGDDMVQEAQNDVVGLCRKLEQDEKIASLSEVIRAKQEGVVPKSESKAKE